MFIRRGIKQAKGKVGLRCEHCYESTCPLMKEVYTLMCAVFQILSGRYIRFALGDFLNFLKIQQTLN